MWVRANDRIWKGKGKGAVLKRCKMTVWSVNFSDPRINAGQSPDSVPKLGGVRVVKTQLAVLRCLIMLWLARKMKDRDN
jgi:hypothetical protein